MPSASPSSENERIYACAHCPKRYTRKDYLERHELNHTRPGSVCPACGKGFARPDVLRKHLSTSCKSRRGSDGDAPAPLSMAEEDALVPRKRRRPQRRATLPGPSPSPSSEDGMSPGSQSHSISFSARTAGHPYAYDRSERDRRRGSASAAVTLPYSHSRGSVSGPSASVSKQQQQYASSNSGTLSSISSSNPSLSSHSPAPSVHSVNSTNSPDSRPTFPRVESYARFRGLDLDARFGGSRLPLAQPQSPLEEDSGPARVGASLEVPLAPAFAATPETLGPLFTPAYTLTPEVAHAPASNGGHGHGHGHAHPHPHAHTHAHAQPHAQHEHGHEQAHAHGHNQGNGHGHAHSAPPAQGNGQCLAGAMSNGAAQAAWSAHEGGSQMDDLFNWFFTAGPGQAHGQQALSLLHGHNQPHGHHHNHGHAYAPAESKPSSVRSMESMGSDEADADAEGEMDDVLSPLGQGFEALKTPSTPLVHVPNIPQQHPCYPASQHNGGYPFPAADDSNQAPPQAGGPQNGAPSLPQWPRDMLDSHSREELFQLFEGAARDDPCAPAWSLGQMRMYFELYFM